MRHTAHPKIVKRLKRAQGHLRSTIAMIDDKRPCLELAQQLQAIERAVANAKRELIHDHIDHCLGDAVRDETGTANGALAELRTLGKYL